jgi:hypothetical protein
MKCCVALLNARDFHHRLKIRSLQKARSLSDRAFLFQKDQVLRYYTVEIKIIVAVAA